MRQNLSHSFFVPPFWSLKGDSSDMGKPHMYSQRCRSPYFTSWTPSSAPSQALSRAPRFWRASRRAFSGALLVFSQFLTLTFFHASFSPFKSFCLLASPFLGTFSPPFSPQKSALLCRAAVTAQSLERGSFGMDRSSEPPKPREKQIPGKSMVKTLVEEVAVSPSLCGSKSMGCAD